MSELTVGVATYGRGAPSSRVRLFHWLDRAQPRMRVLDYIGSSDNAMRSLFRRPIAVSLAERRLRGLEQDLMDGVVTRLIVSRRASPFGSGRIEGRLLSTKAHSVYDFDDAIMLLPASRWANPRLKWATSVRSANIVVAGNAYLGDHASALNSNVVVIPSCVEPAEYPRKISYDVGDPPTAVWMGTPATESYLIHIREALLTAHKETGLRLRVVSAGRRTFGELDEVVDRVEWKPESYGLALCSSDLGVMPLPSNPWTRGKCAYKLLQYGAVGLPIVGDPVGASAAVLDRAGGVAPRNASEWAEALVSLVRLSAGARAAMGCAARRCVVDNYSYAAWESEWCSAVGLKAK